MKNNLKVIHVDLGGNAVSPFTGWHIRATQGDAHGVAEQIAKIAAEILG